MEGEAKIKIVRTWSRGYNRDEAVRTGRRVHFRRHRAAHMRRSGSLREESMHSRQPAGRNGLMDEIILFGYQGDGASIHLYEDGTLVWMSDGRTAAFAVQEAAMRKIHRILEANYGMLKECASRINGKTGSEGENFFIFRDCRIVDWNLTRWYQEEDRSIHPEYYGNTVKVELVENLVRTVFDEICDVIGAENNRLLYGRTVMRGS